MGIRFRKMVPSLSIMFCHLYAMIFLLGELGGSIPILVQGLQNSKVLDSFIRNGCTCIIVLFALFMNHYQFRKIKHIPYSVYFFTSFLNLFILIISWYSGFYLRIREFENALFQFIVFFFLLVTDVFAYFILHTLCRKNEEKMDLVIKNDELEKNEELMLVSDQNLEKLRMLRHDCKNQYATMKVLLEEKRYDELDKFFLEYGDGVIEPISFISVNNRIISSILNMEYSKAMARGVQFDCKIAIPDQLPYYSTDLTSLLCNVLDNAIEATCQVDVEKRILIRMRVYQDFFYMEVVNPIKDGLTMEMIRKTRTTKKDADQHGYGRKIISSIVKKYNGTKKDEIIGGMYHVTIMLSNPTKKEDEE